MPSLQDIISGAAGGAMAGSVIPGIGGAIGAGVGAIGSLFGKSQAQKNRESYEATRRLIGELKAAAEARRAKQLRVGVGTIGRYGGSLVSGARSAAKQRAASTGRTDVESFVLPAEQRAGTSANRAMTQFVSDVNIRADEEQAALDRAELTAKAQYDAGGNEPSVGDSILATGGAIGQTVQTKNYIDALKNYTGGGGDNKDNKSQPESGYSRPSMLDWTPPRSSDYLVDVNTQTPGGFNTGSNAFTRRRGSYFY